MKFGGGGGGMKDLQKMMKQVQKMQEELVTRQGELESKEYEGTAGGAVKVVVNGKYELLRITIEKDVVDPADVESLQEMLLLAGNAAIKAARDEQESMAKGMMSGIPGMPGLPGF